MSTPEPIVLNTESILKTVCGTAVTGHANSCDHDHSGQAAALVAQISGVAAHMALRELLADEEDGTVTTGRIHERLAEIEALAGP